MVHNVVPHERHVADIALTRTVLRRCDQAVVHTSPLATELAAIAPGVEVAVTPHPPNVILTPQPLPPGPPWRILVFGHVRDYKGLDLALDTVAELRGRDVPVEMTVAGQFWGPLEPWQERLEVAGLGGIVSLKPGYIADADLDELFAGHHLVLSAYRSATTSGVVPLAASAGRASVVTPVGGLAEQVIDGVSGIVSVGTNPHEIADAIGRAISMVQSLTSGATAIPTGWNGVAMALAKNPLHR
jgi:glycosyltransferase involved in cell wall biosynthesis